MKDLIREKISAQLEKLGVFDINSYSIETPKREDYGDYSTNIAFLISKHLREKPQDVALRLSEALNSEEITAQALGGFINFTLNEGFVKREFKKLLVQGGEYYKKDIGKGKRVILEFVSANPTGPMHVGHGRGAVVGDVIGKLLETYGYKVYREYYINDAGYQVHLLGLSILYRYMELHGVENEELKKLFEEEGYKGNYIMDLAKDIKAFYGDSLIKEDIEKAIEVCRDYGIRRMMEDIKETLQMMNVSFDNYFSERSLVESGAVEEILELLKAYTYEKDGALWFKASEFGDEKDRVLKRSDGTYTYFANDIAYHYNKYRRGFDFAINLWGADHHGYLQRLMGALKALGVPEGWLKVEFVQMVKLFSNGQEVRMSKRTGEFITLKELLEDVGQDAVRFMFLTKRSDTPLDFDIDIVKEKSSENPVFYVQYAHARIRGVIREVKARYGLDADSTDLSQYVDKLIQESEIRLMKKCILFKDVLMDVVENVTPHTIVYHLLSISKDFHNYYNHNRVMSEDEDLMKSRLALFKGIEKVLAHGLELIGVHAPEHM